MFHKLYYYIIPFIVKKNSLRKNITNADDFLYTKIFLCISQWIRSHFVPDPTKKPISQLTSTTMWRPLDRKSIRDSKARGWNARRVRFRTVFPASHGRRFAFPSYVLCSASQGIFENQHSSAVRSVQQASVSSELNCTGKHTVVCEWKGHPCLCRESHERIPAACLHVTRAQHVLRVYIYIYIYILYISCSIETILVLHDDRAKLLRLVRPLPASEASSRCRRVARDYNLVSLCIHSTGTDNRWTSKFTATVPGLFLRISKNLDGRLSRIRYIVSVYWDYPAI